MRRDEQTVELALAFLGASVRTPAELLEWLAAHDLAGGRLATLRKSPPDAAVVLSEAHRLREAAAQALEAFTDGRAPPTGALHGIDRVLRAALITRRLGAGPEGPRLHEEERGGELRAALAPLALGIATVLTSADPGRVRRCAALDCGAWFLDTSKGGRRKWCSMATCGNRAKAARHRRRERAARARAG